MIIFYWSLYETKNVFMTDRFTLILTNMHYLRWLNIEWLSHNAEKSFSKSKHIKTSLSQYLTSFPLLQLKYSQSVVTLPHLIRTLTNKKYTIMDFNLLQIGLSTSKINKKPTSFTARLNKFWKKIRVGVNIAKTWPKWRGFCIKLERYTSLTLKTNS